MKQLLRILLLALLSLAAVQPMLAQFGISVSFGPPALPVYDQPVCPQDGYLWTPGYWAYDPDGGYYWVPGTWVAAPEPGYLWTPGYWGWGDGGYRFSEGYWATEVGFYGGINYGFGYFGDGFGGGRWDGGHFRYNTAVFNVNTTIIHNTYIDRTVIVNTTINHVSYNGGQGGIGVRPTPEQEHVGQLRHIAPVAEQTQHVQAARSNPQLRASANQGKPPIAATERPGALSGRNVIASKEAGEPYHAPAARGGEQAGVPNTTNRPGPPGHAKDLAPHQPAVVPSTGNVKTDQKYQQKQAQLAEKQNQEHMQLQQKQEMEDRKPSNSEKNAQIEQKHQQQTQKLEERHTQQQQQLQTRQTPHSEPRPR